ncbi:MAG TPA: DsbE family thiol:disulfide interchange protein [Patescibacteria group bacterium]|nr:DsbE family thiol:disulfide interchange protein [Patescibacteria group bacterium]
MRYLVPLLLFLGLGVLLFSGLGKDTRYVPSPLIDKPAAAYTLPELRDPAQTIDSKQFSGKPYLLNVWGSWCVACQEEHPVLLDYAKSKKIPLVGLNWKDENDTALRWLAALGDPYDAIPVDADGKVAIDYGVYGAPETFLIDANGVIRFKQVGPMTREIIAKEIEPRLAAMGVK